MDEIRKEKKEEEREKRRVREREGEGKEETTKMMPTYFFLMILFIYFREKERA